MTQDAKRCQLTLQCTETELAGCTNARCASAGAPGKQSKLITIRRSVRSDVPMTFQASSPDCFANVRVYESFAVDVTPE